VSGPSPYRFISRSLTRTVTVASIVRSNDRDNTFGTWMASRLCPFIFCILSLHERRILRVVTCLTHRQEAYYGDGSKEDEFVVQLLERSRTTSSDVAVPGKGTAYKVQLTLDDYVPEEVHEEDRGGGAKNVAGPGSGETGLRADITVLNSDLSEVFLVTYYSVT